MIYASDFRKGITFEINGEPHVVLDFQHVKPGKGAAFVRTKYKNILNKKEVLIDRKLFIKTSFILLIKLHIKEHIDIGIDCPIR